ncbi:MAG: SDR family NAD(P)-dependent oxidoreductase [Pseudomonadota bacterium]
MRRFDFKGACVWLTGASSGIGEALAHELTKRGARVAITARRAEVLESLRKAITEKGGTVACFPGDVRDLDDMKRIVASIEGELGPIDLAIPNAGTHIFTVPEEFNSREYIELMELNFGGMLHCIEAVLPGMLQRGGGRIAPVASLAGYRGLPRAAAYGASKSAMIHFLESIRFHLVNKGITISIVNPGFVKTPLTDKNDFRMPFLVDAPRAAKIICDGIERGKREVAFPFPFNWVLKIARVLPAPLYESIVNRCW